MLNITEIKSLMEKMNETNLGEFEIKSGDFKLKLKSKEPAAVVTQVPQVASYSCESNEVIVANVAPSAPVKAEVCGNVVKSPIVGTFYSAAAPDKPAFVSVGKAVRKGDVLFVIESMKLMNEIQSEFDGTVTEICIDNAQAVEFGQPIMIIK